MPEWSVLSPDKGSESMLRNEDAKPQMLELVSIGHLAESTGISIDTIRAWERRYGRPIPQRLPSGHRRYEQSNIAWLRRISEGLAKGFRPSKLVKLSEDELDSLLGKESIKEEDKAAHAHQEKLIDLVRDFQGGDLREQLEQELLQDGLRPLLRETVGPLVTAVGRAWADGTIEVRHEHFLTEILEDFLRLQRNALPRMTKGPIVVLSSLSGEPHSLGLQMAAVYAALAGCRPFILGADMPNDEIVLAATENDANVVAISISLASGGVKTDRVLEQLRKSLPEEIRLVAGGSGASGVRRGVRGVHYSKDLDQFENLLRELAEQDAD
ncbi:MAG: DNA-binding transcriptional MerR regulator/methylmalonyl-CoA mutase cobalamin-binding subunit [Planctomycetota bacterium]|jgi:DNA-binding transcriptional MerR regulator/methylmalonyl-CoA mutase cobalamin-binding subunit